MRGEEAGFDLSFTGESDSLGMDTLLAASERCDVCGRVLISLK